MVVTKYGELDESQLEKRESSPDQPILVVEYYLDGELVHRSAVIRLSGLEAAGIAKI